MANFLQLVNGIPTMVEVPGSTPYNESTYLASATVANTSLFLPNSGIFSDSDAKDILIIVNKRVVEVTRDFTVQGAGPTYNEIKFIYDLPVDTVVNFIKGV